jgi:hypothetical protein
MSGNFGSDITPFVSADVGMTYEWLSFSNTPSGVTNSSLSFSAQIDPGVDIPVFGNFGVIGELPVRMIFTNTNLILLDAIVSLRLKL